jgi:putative tryptophan/tyrosine transport system substrate-binding protein
MSAVEGGDADMRRRSFLRLLGGAGLALPARAMAEAAAAPRIGYLGVETPASFETRLRAFRQGLADLGYEEGRNLVVEYRWAEGHNERLAALAADLVRADVSVIAAPGGVASALAAKGATSTIPIIFEIGADPVEAGLVSNLNRPSGNITGVSSLNTQIGPKRLELLHEIVSAGQTFALVVDSTNPRNAVTSAQNLRDAALNLGVKLEVLNASAEADLEPLFTKLAELKASGLVINNDPFLSAHAKQLAELSLRHSIPAAHQSRDFAVAGGLLSYGGSLAQSHHQAGVYVGRILKGEKVADLPVQQITKVEMTVNLKTAKILGVTVPLSLTGRADEVIE